MDASDNSSHYSTEFTLDEMVDMENLLHEYGDQVLIADFCEKFSAIFSDNRNGKSSVTSNQVQNWFQESLKHKTQLELGTLPSPSLQNLDSPNLSNADNGGNDVGNGGNATGNGGNAVGNGDSAIGNGGNAVGNGGNTVGEGGNATGNGGNVVGDGENAAGNTSVQRRKGKPSDIANLAFEAQTATDKAWYDVDSFINYRVARTGEMEVRVRFSGFDHHHDEWVNVKKSVRERSIPLKPSECGKVNVGDLVLCFKEKDDLQLYCDAHVLSMERGIHDQGKCDCMFLVCFDHHNTKWGRVAFLAVPSEC